MIQAKFRVGLIPEAWVYHKRRTDLRKFYRQAFNSGNARINLTLRHPGTLKLTHFFPAAITMYSLFALAYTVLIPHGWASLIPLAAYHVLIFIHASVTQSSLHVGMLSVAASFVQLTGYGLGFLRGLWFRVVLGKPEGHAFNTTYYR